MTAPAFGGMGPSSYPGNGVGSPGGGGADAGDAASQGQVALPEIVTGPEKVYA